MYTRQYVTSASSVPVSAVAGGTVRERQGERVIDHERTLE